MIRMPRTQAAGKSNNRAVAPGGGRLVLRALAGKWIAWSSDGQQIVAVGDSFESCEAAAARAGFPAESIAIDRTPMSRDRLTGSGM